MSLPAAFRKIVEWYNLSDITDAISLTATDVLAVKGIGETALNRLRVFLAGQRLSLQNDMTADYWLEFLANADGKLLPHPPCSPCPFRIVRCVNESLPFHFTNICTQDGLPVHVEVIERALWAQGLADYTIEGFEREVQIERKGDDLAASLSHRRENFTEEIRRMNDLCLFAAIVIEHEWSNYVATHSGHGASVVSTARTWTAWQVAFPNVHWLWMPGRTAAEQMTFALLNQYWWSRQKELTAMRARQRELQKWT